MIRYPCFSPSARAKSTKNIAGESGSISCKSLLSEADGFIQEFLISLMDISILDICQLVVGKQCIRRAVWDEHLSAAKAELHVGDVFDCPLTFWVDEMLMPAV